MDKNCGYCGKVIKRGCGNSRITCDCTLAKKEWEISIDIQSVKNELRFLNMALSTLKEARGQYKKNGL